ncbi:hypothetical protein GGTG_13606 [Gaeumannomyces tritici R3-111a-1]|uniref:Uncharacterized protein n=1 Tax=Gaeumannomyces tritici (strain R3-111a-1) TaxID=644352 RepID=J3PJC7_GAET3|nr:hypothetical protein GGTG_13606 [Gaeumannomyces tritici R3-111a-1]EJT68828.1 hypothetical protein GGTG_13606 [Gaeumannomyces tritici R3-111a-1]
MPLLTSSPPALLWLRDEDGVQRAQKSPLRILAHLMQGSFPQRPRRLQVRVQKNGNLIEPLGSLSRTRRRILCVLGGASNSPKKIPSVRWAELAEMRLVSGDSRQGGCTRACHAPELLTIYPFDLPLASIPSNSCTASCFRGGKGYHRERASNAGHWPCAGTVKGLIAITGIFTP